jgi:hypothetical protein
MNKAQHAFKQNILDHTSLVWVTKDRFKLPIDISFPEGLSIIEQELVQIGYSLDTTYFEPWKNNVYLLFVNGSEGFELELKCIKTYEYMVALFQFVVDRLQLRETSYYGSKEWFNDRCRWKKIPMRDQLSILDPPNGQYWYCNKLCGGIN